MNRSLYLLLISIFCAVSVNAQRLAIGEKAPEIKVAEWLTDSPVPGKATLLEFFHSSNDQCIKALPQANEIAKRFLKLNVVIITKEGFEKVEKYLNTRKGYVFYMGYDEGKVFAAYDVRFVPFAVLLDSRGRLVWTGNVSSLSDDLIKSALR